MGLHRRGGVVMFCYLEPGGLDALVALLRQI